ncbi:hypothetical protein GCM10010981_35590 [Dyella nitratireducens]|uniref:Uncharacterized protein n=2 Tax=Dyella nitratireducens TaxID=1849580 RepID=A0ABQ1GGU2_9GAMM|nr:hypothetical protein GCM10010981_35590 [Dyella nitratireducens]
MAELSFWLNGEPEVDLSEIRAAPKDTSPEPEFARSTGNKEQRTTAGHADAIQNECSDENSSRKKMMFHVTSETIHRLSISLSEAGIINAH